MAQQTDVATNRLVLTERPARGDAGALERGQLRTTPGFYRRAWRRFRRDRISLAALVVTILVVAFVLGADLIARYVTGHDYYTGNLFDQFKPPLTDGHILGTDVNGRDVLTRMAYGGRVSLLVAGLAGTTALLIGSTIGAVSGYFGGVTDAVLMRIVDVLLCVPFLSILILVAALFRPGPVALAIILALFGWTGVARLVRGEVLSLRSRDFVDASRVLGANDARIIWRHIMPNIVPILVVWMSLTIPGLILTEAALSFLGFGVTIPTPSWGNMLQGARDYYTRSIANVIIPGLMIYVTVLAINLVGKGLRDALDPRLSD